MGCCFGFCSVLSSGFSRNICTSFIFGAGSLAKPAGWSGCRRADFGWRGQGRGAARHLVGRQATVLVESLKNSSTLMATEAARPAGRGEQLVLGKALAAKLPTGGGALEENSAPSRFGVFSLKKPTLLAKALHFRPQSKVGRASASAPTAAVGREGALPAQKAEMCILPFFLLQEWRVKYRCGGSVQHRSFLASVGRRFASLSLCRELRVAGVDVHLPSASWVRACRSTARRERTQWPFG